MSIVIAKSKTSIICAMRLKHEAVFNFQEIVFVTKSDLLNSVHDSTQIQRLC